MARRPEFESTPKAVRVREHATERGADRSFCLDNDGGDELELIAIEEDVYSENRSLLRRRRVDTSTRIGPGEQRTVRNPMSASLLGTLLGAVVYTFTFRTPAGDLSPLAVRVSPIGACAFETVGR